MNDENDLVFSEKQKDAAKIVIACLCAAAFLIGFALIRHWLQ